MDNINFYVLVNRLNDDIFEQLGDTETYVTYTSDGFAASIDFCGIQIWNSENDEREYTEFGYESIEPFIRKRITELCTKLGKLNLIEKGE